MQIVKKGKVTIDLETNKITIWDFHFAGPDAINISSIICEAAIVLCKEGDVNLDQIIYDKDLYKIKDFYFNE